MPTLLLLCWPSAFETAPAEAVTDTPHGDLSISSHECHSAESWTDLIDPLGFDHATTGFPLVGMHRTVPCLTCHLQLVLANIGSACADCHVDPHSGELGFGCEECHSTLSRDPRFGLEAFHDATLFPLTGAHRALECGSCHRENPPFEFQLTPLDCFACHREDFLDAEPDHRGAGFSMRCEECHGTEAWSPAEVLSADIEHDFFFPLRGAHEALDCEACHRDGFAGTPRECLPCHEADYLSATDPAHVALGFSTDCEACHSTSSWEGATRVEHDRFFPLAGAHAVLDCGECHAAGFAGTPRDCDSCHALDFLSVVDPDHAGLGLARDCEQCHFETSWIVSTIDHEPFAPLRGAHRELDCGACHPSGFAATPAECVGCHEDSYLGVAVPDHLEAGFSTACEDCHRESAWEPAIFDHFWFPHVGGHSGLECDSCHAERFEGTSAECVSCHRADYQRARNPDHVAAGLPLDCELCHDVNGWEGAEFDHSGFPLVQGHAGLDCFDCHEEGGFEGASTLCFDCHEDDYDAVRDPDHDGAGFPRSCEDCHWISDWSLTRFDHDRLYYPIYDGSHRDVWDTCATCHIIPSDFGVFECLLCHDHNQRDTDADHEGVEGYMYESQACLNCHSIPR